MYRQIQVYDKHCDYQRILWRKKDNEPIKTYRLTTVTYGTVLASYLVTACLRKLSEIGQGQYPNVAPLIAHDFYMDDFISGAATKKEAIEIRDGLIKLMATAKLELGKWASNDFVIIRDVVDKNDGLVDF
uniref:Reverse transcriptase domain-containing protein n=1 Tax=Schizaphis graminum TaxID=13262 RepID=A0A2S2NZK2_SCHGA